MPLMLPTRRHPEFTPTAAWTLLPKTDEVQSHGTAEVAPQAAQYVMPEAILEAEAEIAPPEFTPSVTPMAIPEPRQRVARGVAPVSPGMPPVSAPPYSSGPEGPPREVGRHRQGARPTTMVGDEASPDTAFSVQQAVTLKELRNVALSEHPETQYMRFEACYNYAALGHPPEMLPKLLMGLEAYTMRWPDRRSGESRMRPKVLLRIDTNSQIAYDGFDLCLRELRVLTDGELLRGDDQTLQAVLGIYNGRRLLFVREEIPGSDTATLLAVPPESPRALAVLNALSPVEIQSARHYLERQRGATPQEVNMVLDGADRANTLDERALNSRLDSVRRHARSERRREWLARPLGWVASLRRRRQFDEPLEDSEAEPFPGYEHDELARFGVRRTGDNGLPRSHRRPAYAYEAT